jgi:hypothetical protein
MDDSYDTDSEGEVRTKGIGEYTKGAGDGVRKAVRKVSAGFRTSQPGSTPDYLHSCYCCKKDHRGTHHHDTSVSYRGCICCDYGHPRPHEHDALEPQRLPPPAPREHPQRPGPDYPPSGNRRDPVSLPISILISCVLTTFPASAI